MGKNELLDKELNDMLGESAKLLNCQKCGKELIECPHCHEMLCPDGCGY